MKFGRIEVSPTASSPNGRAALSGPAVSAISPPATATYHAIGQTLADCRYSSSVSMALIRPIESNSKVSNRVALSNTARYIGRAVS